MKRTNAAIPSRAGYLRRSVEVERNGDCLELRFSLWSLTIPVDYIELDSSLAAFFRRELPAISVRDTRVPSRNLLALLEAQGCLASAQTPSIPLGEVGKLFHAIAAEWYQDYYSHRLWPMLREGAVNRSQLDAWMLRTYFLSRSAGVTAARCASLCSEPRIRALFAHNAIEEFDHCDRYYKHHGVVVDAMAPVSSIAFDQQMMRLAEADWLAHVFVALFQEKTAAFIRNAKSLYDRLAQRYSLGDRLEPWKEHIAFDIGHGHADAFAKVFNNDTCIERGHFLASVEHARITVCYLLGGLEQILRDDDGTSAISIPRLAGGSFADALASFRDATRPRPQAEQQFTSLADRLQPLAFRALSYCTTHEEILLLGRLCEQASGTAASHAGPVAVTPAQMAVENQLRESAYRPTEFILALGALDHLLASRLLSDRIGREIDMYLSAQSAPVSESGHAACEQVYRSWLLGFILWHRPVARDPFGW